MVELLTAHVTQAAVFGARRLRDLACPTPRIISEHHIVEWISFHRFYQLLFVHTFVQVASICITCLVIAPVAERHRRPCNPLMLLADIGIRYMLKTIHHVTIIAANSERQVHELNCRVSLIACIAYRSFDYPQNSLSTAFLYRPFDRIR